MGLETQSALCDPRAIGFFVHTKQETPYDPKAIGFLVQGHRDFLKKVSYGARAIGFFSKSYSIFLNLPPYGPGTIGSFKKRHPMVAGPQDAFFRTIGILRLVGKAPYGHRVFFETLKKKEKKKKYFLFDSFLVWVVYTNYCHYGLKPSNNNCHFFFLGYPKLCQNGFCNPATNSMQKNSINFLGENFPEKEIFFGPKKLHKPQASFKSY